MAERNMVNLTIAMTREGRKALKQIALDKDMLDVVTQVYDKMGDGGVDMLDVAELFRTGENELVELEGDGDFRSPECLALLDESDITPWSKGGKTTPDNCQMLCRDCNLKKGAQE